MVPTPRVPLLLLFALGCMGHDRTSVSNVVLITVDTLRADHVGVYGGPVPTPAIDALAAEGVLVGRAFTPVPSTGPAIVSLLSGLHPWHHRVLLNATSPAEDLPSLPERLQKAGFATAAFVSSYVVGARFGFDRGFDVHHFEPTMGGRRGGGKERAGPWWSTGEHATTAALRWLDSGIREPFFLWVHYMDPHDPYRPPAGYERPADELVDLQGKKLTRKVKSFDQLRTLILYYRGSVAYTDEQIGRLMAGLRSHSLLDRSAVFLTSDHGEGLGDHGLLGHGKNLFDELVHVPLVVRAPGLPAGRRVEGLAQLEDLMPTILSMLGLPVPAELDGMNLLPWLRGEAETSPRQAVVGRLAGIDPTTLFYELRGSHKWIGGLDGSGVVFRLGSDSKERAGQPVRRLPLALQRQGEALANEGVRRVLDEESRDGLRALGYLE